jgi:PAS domain S-box-containing protein
MDTPDDPTREPFAAMVNSTRDLMTLVDFNLVYREANRAYLEARGLERHQVVGRTVSELWGSEVLDSLVGGALCRALAGEPVRYQALFEVSPGNLRSMEVSYDPVLGPTGEASHVLITSRDRSEEKRVAEELQIAREEIETAAHHCRGRLQRLAGELAAPAGQLLDRLAAAEGELEPAARREQIEGARQAVHELLAKSEEMAGVVPAGVPAQSALPFRLATLLEEVTLPAGRAAAARGLLMVVDTAPDLPVHVRGDRLRLREALRDLLAHAVERTPGGSVRLQVLREGDDHLRFELRGSPGPAEILRRHQQQAAQLGGRLGPGEEGALVLSVPLAAAGAEVAKAAPQRAGAPRILLVDDNPTNLEVAGAHLARRGLAVDFARDGAEALERLARGGYDLLFLDCRMPGLDGHAVARTHRRREAGEPGRRLPIVALTADAVAGDRERCLEAGMDDYLTKPMGSDDLDRVLARWLPAGDDDGAPALDPKVIASLDDPDDPEFLTELVDLFLADSPPRLDTLARAVAERNWEAAVEAAHALQGSAANMGAKPLGEICRRALALARSQNGEIAQATAQAGRELARVAAALRSLVADRR